MEGERERERGGRERKGEKERALGGCGRCKCERVDSTGTFGLEG